MKKLLALSTAVTLYSIIPTHTINNQINSKQPPKFKSRTDHLNQCKNISQYDLIIIGGGCSGSGVLLDACTRGYKTLLLQSQDFSSGASSKSTKLIHGGVRYLQQVFSFNFSSISSRLQKFKLVKEAIQQRTLMIQNAEYMNKKIQIAIPCKNMFQSIYFYVGSILYHTIYLFFAEKNKIKFDFPYFVHNKDLRNWFPFISDKYTSGVIYEDGQFNDAQMNLNLLLTATLPRNTDQKNKIKFQPGNILNQAQVLKFVKQNDKIVGIVFRDKLSNQQITVKSRYVINCTGAWADKIRKMDDPTTKDRIIPVAGSHITYHSSIGSLKYGLCMPTSDGRILLILPWLNKIIAGTTQKTYEQPLHNPTITFQQKKFISQQVLDTFDKLSINQLEEMQTSSWTGLRPLVLTQNTTDTKSVARNHVIQKSKSGLYSLMGGKWTIYRKMGQQMIDVISKDMQERYSKKFIASGTKYLRLIGSDDRLKQMGQNLAQLYGYNYIKHLVSTYGSLTQQIVKGDNTILDYETLISKAEIDFIVKNTMVNRIQDVVLRRTRIAFLNNNKINSQIIPYILQSMGRENNWDEQRKKIELQRFYNNYQKFQF